MTFSPFSPRRVLGGLLLALLPAVAFAGEAVDLKPQPQSHGAVVTLGDLFDGVEGPAAQVTAGRAASAAGLQSVLQADRVQAIARNAGLDWDNARGLHRIIVTSAGAASEPSTGRRAQTSGGGHRRPRQALAYARNLMAGDIVSASDLTWSDEAVAAQDSPGDPDTVVGKAARRPLREGAVVETRDLVSPTAVHRNDTITVAYDSDGVSLALEAKAINDGSVGDTVQVVNPQSKKVIEAVVSAPGRAVVGPQADLVKAYAFNPSFRTAALQ